MVNVGLESIGKRLVCESRAGRTCIGGAAVAERLPQGRCRYKPEEARIPLPRSRLHYISTIFPVRAFNLSTNINFTRKLFQAESVRVKAVMSLGDMYVLNLRRPPPPLQGSAPASARGRRVSPFDSDGAAAATTAASGTDAAHHHRVRGAVERGGSCLTVEDECSLAWVGPPLGRSEGAVGPMLDVALVVVPCGMGGLPAGGGVGVGDCTGMVGAAGGLEARVKIRLDAVRTNASVPFVENLALHVLSGPLVSLLLQNDGAAGNAESPGGAGSLTPLSPSPPPVVPQSTKSTQATADENRWGTGDSADSNDAADAADDAAAVTGPVLGRSSSSSSMPTVAPAEKVLTRRRESAGDAPPLVGGGGGKEDGNSWEQLVLIKVCKCIGLGGNKERAGEGLRSVSLVTVWQKSGSSCTTNCKNF